MQSADYLINLTDSQNRNILGEIKRILGEITYPANDILMTDFITNELIPQFKKCFEYLISIYFDNTVYKQEVIIINQSNNYEKLNALAIEKTHQKIMALTYLLYLNELYVHFILYKPIKESNTNRSTSTGIFLLTNDIWNRIYNQGRETNLQRGFQPYDNLALSLWSNRTDLSLKYRIHKDSIINALSFTLDSNGVYRFLNQLDNLCNQLDNYYNLFIKKLIENINLITLFTVDEINNALFFIMNTPSNLTREQLQELNRNHRPVYYYKNLRSDWIESLKQLLESKMVYDSNREIETTIHNTLTTLDSNYTTDSNSIFSWMYLAFRDPSRNYSSCINQTILEQYIFCRIYYPTNKFSIGLQYTINRGHIYYRYTKKELNNINIGHWTSSYKGYFTNRKYDLRLSTDGTITNGRIYNLCKDPYLYLISFIYVTFDYTQNFLILNKCRFDSYNTQSAQYSVYFDFMTDNIGSFHELFSTYIKNYKSLNTSKMVENLEKENYVVNDINLSDVTDIVDYIIQTNEIFNNQNNLNNICIDEESNKIDDNLFLKDIATSFISNLYFMTNDSLINYIELITTLINNALALYFEKKIMPIIGTDKNVSDYMLFLFKGGNALRLIFLQQIKNFPHELDEIKQDIKKYFKKSDNDFSIYIRDIPGVDMDLVIENITNIAYLILNRIRNIIVMNLPKYISYYHYNNKKKINLLNTKFLKLANNSKSDSNKYRNANFIRIESDDIAVNNNDIITDDDFNDYCKDKTILENTDPKTLFGTIKSQNGRRDFGITVDERNNILLNGIDFLHENLIKYKDICDTKYQQALYKNIFASNFAISINKSINTFNLVRTKVNFKLYYEENNLIYPVNIGGELIDISILKHHRGDFFEHLDQFYKDYELINDSGNTINIKSYSLKYYMLDLIGMVWGIKNVSDIPSPETLHDNLIMPWFGKIKRLDRLLIISIFDYVRYNPSTELIQQTRDVINQYLFYLTHISLFIQVNNIHNATNKQNVIHNLNMFIIYLKTNVEYVNKKTKIRSNDFINSRNIIQILKLIPNYINSYIQYLEFFNHLIVNCDSNPDDFNEYVAQYFTNPKDTNTKVDSRYNLNFENIANRDSLLQKYFTSINYDCIIEFNKEFLNSLNIFINYLNKFEKICDYLIATKSTVNANTLFMRTDSSKIVEL